MFFVNVAIAVLCTVNSELTTTEYDNLNETEKQWHQDIIRLTLVDNASSLYSCLLSERPCCSCSSECYSLGTCCIDAYFLQSPMPTVDYLDFMSRKVYTNSPSTCLPILVGLPGRHQVQRIMQVATCPVSYVTGSANLTKQRLCETEAPHYFEGGVISPTLVTQDQIFYRNQFCAECNGAYDSKRVNFTGDNCEILMSARNVTSVTFKDLVNCNFKVSMTAPDCLLLPALQRPSHIGGWSAYSHNCSRDEYRLCFVYTKPVVEITYPKPTLEPTYANRHCLMCLRNETIHQAGSCKPPIRPRTLITFGYSVLVTFSDYETETLVRNPCKDYAFYDKALGGCIPMKCMEPYRLTSKGCEIPWTLTPTPFLPLVGLQKNNLSGKGAWRKEFYTCTMSSSESSIYAVSNFETVTLQERIIRPLAVQILDEEARSGATLNFFEATFHLNISLDKVILSSEPVVRNWLYPDSMYHHFPNHRLCSDFVDLTDHFELQPNCSFLILPNLTEPNDLQAYRHQPMPADRISFRIEWQKNFTTYKVLYCKEFHLHSNCSLRNHSPDSLRILPNNTALIYLQNNEILTLRPDEYVPLENGIGSCFKVETQFIAKESTARLRKLINIASVLSTAGASVSLVSLAFTICVVSAYKVLRTVSGKNIISLSIALMISDGLLLASMHMNLRPSMCRAFGVLLHWSLLAQHLSCLVLAASLAQTFLSPVKANQRSKRGFSRLGFGIWGASAIFVSTCVVLDHYFKNVMQYGHNGICWIYSRKGRVYGYIVPAFGVLLINVILFFTTLRQIHKTRQAVQSVIKKDSTGDQGSTMALGIKLCLLFGLLEVLGVVQLNSSDQASEIINTIFSTMYSVTRSLRGFFLFASFTARKRVWRLIFTSVGGKRTDITHLRTSVASRSIATENSFDLTGSSSAEKVCQSGASLNQY